MTAVIVTSCGCYVTAERSTREDIRDSFDSGDHVQWSQIVGVQLTSKDPQRARVYDSHAKAAARLKAPGWGVDIGPRSLESKDGCEDCDDGDAKIGVMS